MKDLAKRSAPLSEAALPGTDILANQSLVYRAWLDAGLTAKLDERRRRDGFRSRAAVLRALIDGVGITHGESISSRVPGTSEGGRSASLREAVDALGASNFQLVSLGRNISQLIKALRAVPGKPTAIDFLALEPTAAAIRHHVDQASKLVAHLRPMLRRGD
jgi:hypothetical protein